MKSNLSRKTKQITGDDSQITGDRSKIYGDVSGISGNVSGISGNIDLCELNDDDRKNGVDIQRLVSIASK